MGNARKVEIDNDFNEVDETTPKYSEDDIQKIIERKMEELQNKKENKITEDDEPVLEDVPFQTEDGSYFITDNRALHRAFNYMSENNNGLKTFTYVYNLTAERSPFIQISNFNGTHKDLSRQNFIEDFMINYNEEVDDNLVIRPKAQVIDPETGEYKFELKNGRQVPVCINESALIVKQLRKVHGLDYDAERPHSAVYRNEENGRLIYNKFCAPKKLREFQDKAKDLPRINKITLERALEKDYLVVYAFFKNLMNPEGEDNIGEVKFGKNNEDSLDVFFNRQAFILQTLRKTNTYMLFSSEQGVGKNTYYKYFIQYILGKEKAYLSSGDALNEQYNGFVSGKLYIAFDEAKVNSKDNAEAVATRMKKYTNEEIEMREMRTDRYNATSPFNLDVFTNEDILMKLDYSDRRAICIKSGKNLTDKFLAMGIDTFSEFEAVFKSQVDNFILDLLCLEYNENMAVNGVIYNSYRKRIIMKTNKRINILLELIKGRKLDDLVDFFQATPEEERHKLEDLILHIKHNFLTAEDTGFMLQEILEDFNEKGSEFDKTKIWSDNLCESTPVNYINEEGDKKSMRVRKLSGFKNKDLQTVMDIYSRATQTSTINIDMANKTFEGGDIILDIDEDFTEDNLVENKIDKESLYESLKNGNF